MRPERRLSISHRLLHRISRSRCSHSRRFVMNLSIANGSMRKYKLVMRVCGRPLWPIVNWFPDTRPLLVDRPIQRTTSRRSQRWTWSQSVIHQNSRWFLVRLPIGIQNDLVARVWLSQQDVPMRIVRRIRHFGSSRRCSGFNGLGNFWKLSTRR